MHQPIRAVKTDASGYDWPRVFAAISAPGCAQEGLCRVWWTSARLEAEGRRRLRLSAWVQAPGGSQGPGPSPEWPCETKPAECHPCLGTARQGRVKKGVFLELGAEKQVKTPEQGCSGLRFSESPGFPGSSLLLEGCNQAKNQSSKAPGPALSLKREPCVLNRVPEKQELETQLTCEPRCTNLRAHIPFVWLNGAEILN